jgi:four helix bundle protein
MFGFERLEVWQRAVEFADRVYVLTTAFPDHERYGLTSQLRRAAVSISSNIAEGSSRASRKDFARFVEIAYGSLMEVVSQLQIAKRRTFLNNRAFDELYESADELARLLSGLKAGLLKYHDE